MKALKTPGTVTKNQTVTREGGDLAALRPDIIILEYIRRRVIIIYVTVPFENHMVAFDKARERSIQKYFLLAESFKLKGYRSNFTVILAKSVLSPLI